MTKRPVSLFVVLVVLASLISLGSESRFNSPRRNGAPPKGGLSHAALAKLAARNKNANPPVAPPSSIGFLSAPRTGAGGAISGIFPAAMGHFSGGTTMDAVTIVNTGTTTPVYNIAAAINNGSGSFTTKLTTLTGELQQDPVFVGDLNGDGKDDVLVVHPANGGQTTIQGWLSNGDGTFKAASASVPVTTNGFVWATLFDVNGDKIPDVVIADAGTPNGNIWTALGNGDGTFKAATSVAFTGALYPGPSSQGVPGNPIVFADFNGDGKLDFAGPAASSNQIMVYLNNGSGGYAPPVALATPDSVYDSCFLGGGDLNGDKKDELVSANCVKDGTITVYVNNGKGVFAQGVYYPTSSSSARRFPNPTAVSVADVNGDGHDDIVVTDLNDSAVEVFLGKGDGTVTEPTAGYTTGGAPLVPALVADFNGDGKADVVMPDNQLNFVFLEGYGDGSFRSAINYYAESLNGGYEPEGVGLASGDFNGDGIPDIVIGNSSCLSCGLIVPITVFLSNPDGSFQPGVNYGLNSGNYFFQFVAVADFNGDGKLDIAASDNHNGVVQLFYGVGNGTFTTGPTYLTDGTHTNLNPVGIVAADFNGDGKPDIAIINNNSPSAPTTSNVGVLINNGKGGFNTVLNYPLSTVATELTAADLNGDNKLDLVVPLYGVCAAGHCTTPGSAVAVFLGKGDGTFTAQPDFKLVNGKNTYYNPYDAAVADLNGDGKADLVVTIQDVNTFNQGIAVAFGNGNGTFQAPTLLSSSAQAPPLPGYVKIVDLNRDGHLDLVYTNALSATVGIMYGVGNGTFYSPLEFATDRWAWDFALADVNKDGVLDVVATGFEQAFSGVGVLLNTSGDSIAKPVSLPNPSYAGGPVSLTATVAGSKVRGVTTIPTGSVTFFDGSTPLGPPATLNGSGQATLTTSFVVGSHPITAQYAGDTNYVAATSPALAQVVNQSPTSAGLVSTLTQALVGQSVTFTATVASTVSGDTLVPTGTVTFFDGTTALGAPALTNGIAVLKTSFPTAGSHGITAQYSGDTNFLKKTSPVVNVVVSPPVQPDYTLSANPTSQTVNPGTSASYTITMKPTNGYNGTVTINCPSGLPTGVSCNTPLMITSGTATLTIKTTASSAAMLAPAVNRHGGLNLWASLSSLGFVGMVLAGDWKKKRNRQGMAVVLLILALAMILGLVGCGGGSSNSGGGGGGGGGTPAGQYQVQVTATGTAGTNGGNTNPHPLNLTLVVQ